MLDDEVGEGVGEAELDAGGGGFEAAGEGGGRRRSIISTVETNWEWCE